MLVTYLLVITHYQQIPLNKGILVPALRSLRLFFRQRAVEQAPPLLMDFLPELPILCFTNLLRLLLIEQLFLSFERIQCNVPRYSI